MTFVNHFNIDWNIQIKLQKMRIVYKIYRCNWLAVDQLGIGGINAHKQESDC